MAAAEAEGAAIGDAAEVGAGLGTGAAVVDGLGDAAPEQAAIAIARAGRSRETDRFMTGDFLRASGLDGLVGLADRAARSI